MAVSGRSEVWFLYIVRCSDGSLYTGVARNVRARIALHDAGKGARYTRGRGPLTLCAVRKCRSKRLAMQLEYAVKRLPRSSKELLCEKGKLGRFRVRPGVAHEKQP
jgi:putative endonuclease